MGKLDILFEDNHIIAVNKSTSDIVQGDKTGDETLSDKVKKYIKKKYNKPGEVFLGVVHRLDRPVSGVVLFARTSKALTRLNKMFEERQVKKTYYAIVGDLPDQDEAELRHFILKNSEKNKSYAFPKTRLGAKEAILNYRMVSGLKNYYLLEVNLKTGRHHQIRCQLAKIGCPIKGDLKYGASRSNKSGGISLHARKIEFIHPVSKESIRLVAKTPEEENLWKEFKNVISDK